MNRRWMSLYLVLFLLAAIFFAEGCSATDWYKAQMGVLKPEYTGQIPTRYWRNPIR